MLSKKSIMFFYFFFAMFVMTLGFTNCSSPFEGAGPVDTKGGSGSLGEQDSEATEEMKSLAIFEKTLYVDLQETCAACHGTFQKPLFAVEDSLASHRFLFDNEYIDLETPENSYLAIKIRAGHNKFPVELADKFVKSVGDWSDQLIAQVEPEVPEEEKPPTVEDPPKEEQPQNPKPPEENPEKLEATFQSINKLILGPKCVSCHQPKSEGGKDLKEDYTSYASTMTTGSVVAGKSADSELYKEVKSGAMPPGKNDQLSADEVAVIKAWIDAGAKDD